MHTTCSCIYVLITHTGVIRNGAWSASTLGVEDMNTYISDGLVVTARLLRDSP